MFERNTVDRGSDAARKTYAVTLVFNDGHAIAGICHVLATRTLDEELNNTGAYLDFEPYQGERAFISKASIVRISRLDLPKADQLNRSSHYHDSADPYTILGVKRGTPQAEIQLAYHNLAKQYHPDRFVGQDLPPEVLKYVSDMARRVNEAYSMLLISAQQEAQTQARVLAEAAAPKNAFEEFKAHAAPRYA